MQMPSVSMHDLVFSNFIFDRVFATSFCVSLWLFAGTSCQFVYGKTHFPFWHGNAFCILYSHAQNLAPGNKVSSVYFCMSTVGSLMKSVQESVIMEGSLSLLFMMKVMMMVWYFVSNTHKEGYDCTFILIFPSKCCWGVFSAACLVDMLWLRQFLQENHLLDEELSISVVEGRGPNNPAGSVHRSGIHFGMLF